MTTIDTATGEEAPAEISSERVKDIFSAIAKKYERFNAVSSFGAYKLWLAGMARQAPIGSDDDVLDLAQLAWDNGGIRETETRTIVVNSTLKRALTRAFVTDRNYREETRNVGGVNLQTIETDFGRFNIMLDPYVPKDKLLVLSLEELAPRFLEIPGKGHFFAEPLAKTGAADKVQLYGEIGLEYGNEKAHAILTVGANTPSTKVAGVTFDKKTMAVKVGATNTVKASISPLDATDKTVTWASSAAATATVKADAKDPLTGVVTGVTAGTANVTATTKDGAKVATVAVTVSA